MLSPSPGADELFDECKIQGFAWGKLGEGKGKRCWRDVHLVSSEDSCFLISGH